MNLMSKKSNLLLIVGTLLITMGHSGATFAGMFNGGGSTGGGYVVRDPSMGTQSVLLDLFVSKPCLQDEDRQTGTSTLEATEFSLTIGYDNIDVHQLQAFQSLKLRLNAWRQNSPFIVNQIEQAILSANFYLTPLRVAPSSSYYVPEEIKAAHPKLMVEGVVLYQVDLGPVISVPTWNKLGILSQEAILLHEGLRHIQMAYGKAITDKELQELTAKLIFDTPKANAELDQPMFMKRSFGAAIKTQLLYESKKAEFISKFCALFSAGIKAGGLHYSNNDYIVEYIDRINEGACSPDKGSAALLEGSDNVRKIGDVICDLDVLRCDLRPRSEGRQQLDEARDLLNDLQLLIVQLKIQGNTLKLIDTTRALNRVFPGIAEQAIREIIAGGNNVLDRRTTKEVKKMLETYRITVESMINSGKPATAF